MTGFLKSWQHNSSSNSKGSDSTDSPANSTSETTTTTKNKGNFDATKQASMTFFICLVKPVISSATKAASNHNIFDENVRPDHWLNGAVMVPVSDVTQSNDMFSQNRHNVTAADDLKHYSSKHSVDAKYLSVDQM